MRSVRYALIGLAVAAVIYALSGGHVFFLPLLFVLPLGGLFARRGPGGPRRW